MLRMDPSRKDQGKNIPNAKNKCEGLRCTQWGRCGAVQTVTGSSLRNGAIRGLCVNSQGLKSGRDLPCSKHLSGESWGWGQPF